VLTFLRLQIYASSTAIALDIRLSQTMVTMLDRLVYYLYAFQYNTTNQATSNLLS